MIHKVLKFGSGNSNPFKYLLLQNREVKPELLKGDPEITWQVIKESDFSQKYTSLVLTFEEKVPTKDIGQIIDDYESFAFSGVENDQVCRSWIKHEDKGRTELHCIVANTVLSNGKRWAHYYDKTDRKLFESWQEKTNLKHGFSSAKDPIKSRFSAIPPKNLPASKKELFQNIDQIICKSIEDGAVEDRVQIIKILQSSGFDVKPSKNFIGVKPTKSNDKYLRLRGEKYEEGFTIGQSTEAYRQQKRSFERDLSERYDEYERVFIEQLEKRREHVGKRYSDRGKVDPETYRESQPAIEINKSGITSEILERFEKKFTVSPRRTEFPSPEAEGLSVGDIELDEGLLEESVVCTDNISSIDMPTNVRSDLFVNSGWSSGSDSNLSKGYYSGRWPGENDDLEPRRESKNISSIQYTASPTGESEPEINSNQIKETGNDRRNTIRNRIRSLVRNGLHFARPPESNESRYKSFTSSLGGIINKFKTAFRLTKVRESCELHKDRFATLQATEHQYSNHFRIEEEIGIERERENIRDFPRGKVEGIPSQPVSIRENTIGDFWNQDFGSAKELDLQEKEIKQESKISQGLTI